MFINQPGCAEHLIDPEHAPLRKDVKLPTLTCNMWEAGLALTIRFSMILAALKTITPLRRMISSLASLKHHYWARLKSKVRIHQSAI